MAKIPILFIEFCPHSGSSQGLLSELDFIKRHYHREFEPVVVGPPHSIFSAAARRLGFRFYIIEPAEFLYLAPRPLHTLRLYFSTFYFIARIAVRHRIELIHCNHYLWSIYANPIGFLLNKPVVIHLKDVFLLEPKISRLLMKFNPRTHYIAVSRYVEKLFVGSYKLPWERTIMIYDGINQRIFSGIPASQIKQKQNQKNKLVIMMSRVAPERDIEIFIDTAALLLPKYPQLSFVHYGYSPRFTEPVYFRSLQHRIKALGIQNQFHFASYEEDPRQVARILRQAYLSIISARQFALPNTAIESMMCGTPVIALKVGGNPEVVTNSRMGTLVEANSPLLYAQAIEEYLLGNKDYSEAAKLGLEYARATFASDKQYEKIIQLYHQLLDR